MVHIKLENMRDALLKALTPQNLAVLNGQEVEVKPDVFLKLNGTLNFTVVSKDGGIEISFKIAPQIRIAKLLQFYGDLTSVFITTKSIQLRIDGLPDVELEVVS